MTCTTAHGSLDMHPLDIRMLYYKQVSPPQAIGMPMIDVEVIQVQKYAAENPDGDRDTPAPGEPAVSAQAGPESAPAADGQPVLPDAAMSDAQKRAEPEGLEQPVTPKKARIGDQQPVTPVDDDAMENTEERALSPQSNST